MASPNITRLKIQRETLSPGKGGRQRNGRWIVLTVLLAGAFVVYRMVTTKAVEVSSGNVVSIYPSQAYTRLTATGYVVPQTRADVASKATGRLEKMEVAEGDRVQKGQILARIENDDVKASLARAKADVETARTALQGRLADLREAERALARAESLVQKQFLSPAAHDTERARHDRAQAAVSNAKAMIGAAEAAYHSQQVALEYTLIRAPFDGVILSKNADVGDMLAPFATASLAKGAVVSMADLSSLEVEADVSESNLLKVSVGQPCEIQLDAIPDEHFAGRVGSIVPTLDKSKATILVKARFEKRDARLLPDMSAKVAFLSQSLSPEAQRPVRVVPTAALLAGEPQPSVFRIDQDRVTRIPLSPGEKLGDFTAIPPVLNVGDKVVLHPSADLRDGTKIKLIQP